jgi:hypothetical protein
MPCSVLPALVDSGSFGVQSTAPSPAACITQTVVCVRARPKRKWPKSSYFESSYDIRMARSKHDESQMIRANVFTNGTSHLKRALHTQHYRFSSLILTGVRMRPIHTRTYFAVERACEFIDHTDLFGGRALGVQRACDVCSRLLATGQHTV